MNELVSILFILLLASLVQLALGVLVGNMLRFNRRRSTEPIPEAIPVLAADPARWPRRS